MAKPWEPITVHCARCNVRVRLVPRLGGWSVVYGKETAGCKALGEIGEDGKPLEDARECPALKKSIAVARFVSGE